LGNLGWVLTKDELLKTGTGALTDAAVPESFYVSLTPTRIPSSVVEIEFMSPCELRSARSKIEALAWPTGENRTNWPGIAKSDAEHKSGKVAWKLFRACCELEEELQSGITPTLVKVAYKIKVGLEVVCYVGTCGQVVWTRAAVNRDDEETRARVSAYAELLDELAAHPLSSLQVTTANAQGRVVTCWEFKPSSML
jgi:hypothetical protein